MLLAWFCYGALLLSRAIYLRHPARQKLNSEVPKHQPRFSFVLRIYRASAPKLNGAIEQSLSEGGCQVLAEQMSAANRLILGLPLDLNRVEVEDLVLVRGIGETTAKSIVRFRETHGSFKTVDELSKVEGIGEGRLQRLRTHFMVSNSVENRLKVLDSSTDGD